MGKVTNWDELPVMLNVAMVAAVLNYNQHKIRELCRSREIPNMRLGRAFMVPRDALKAWVEQTASVKEA